MKPIGYWRSGLRLGLWLRCNFLMLDLVTQFVFFLAFLFPFFLFFSHYFHSLLVCATICGGMFDTNDRFGVRILHVAACLFFSFPSPPLILLLRSYSLFRSKHSNTKLMMFLPFVFSSFFVLFITLVYLATLCFGFWKGFFLFILQYLFLLSN